MEISEHAVLRFLERVKGIDMNVIRSEMNTPALAIADEFGSPVVIGKNGERMIVRNGVLVTVLAKPMGKGRVR